MSDGTEYDPTTCKENERITTLLSFTQEITDETTDEKITYKAKFETDASQIHDELTSSFKNDLQITFTKSSPNTIGIYKCVVLMGRRGSQGNRRYRSAPHNYAWWTTLLGVEFDAKEHAKAESKLKCNHNTNTCTWDYRGFYPIKAKEHENAKAIETLTTAGAVAFHGHHLPCNRWDRDTEACTSLWKPLPGKAEHDGCSYELTTNGQPTQLEPTSSSNGNACGSKDCLCILSDRVSPLVVSLDGSKPVYTTSPNLYGVSFDMGAGPTQIAWIASPMETPFVALDRNANGQIDDIHELFGEGTEGPSGVVHANGFDALREYDENHDGVIDEQDSIYERLVLWSDLNINGKTELNELRPFKEGVKFLRLDYRETGWPQDQYGNETKLIALAKVINGGVAMLSRVYDVWFGPAGVVQ